MGISNIDVKRINKQKIYNYILEHDEVSMPMIIKDLDISEPTVLQNVNELLEEGLIEENGIFKSTGGRRAKSLAPIVNARYSIGIDITTNHISAILTNLKGDIIKQTRARESFELKQSYYNKIKKL